RPSAHETNRRDLDAAFLYIGADLLSAHAVAERVVQRPQIRRHLLVQVAGQISQLLARFHRWTRQYNPLDLPGLQCFRRLRYGKIRLAGSGRTDSECQGMGFDGFNKALLAFGSCGDVLDVFLVAVAVYLVVQRMPAGMFRKRMDDIIVFVTVMMVAV